MKVIKFISWWWISLGSINQWGISITSTLVVSFVGAMVFGPKFLLAVLGCAVSFLSIMLVYAIYKLIRAKWDEYNEHLEKEQQRVVDKLRGSPVNTGVWGTAEDAEQVQRMSKILESIRKKRQGV